MGVIEKVSHRLVYYELRRAHQASFIVLGASLVAFLGASLLGDTKLDGIGIPDLSLSEAALEGMEYSGLAALALMLSRFTLWWTHHRDVLHEDIPQWGYKAIWVCMPTVDKKEIMWPFGNPYGEDSKDIRGF